MKIIRSNQILTNKNQDLNFCTSCMRGIHNDGMSLFILKILSLYFDWPKSRIWQTLGHVMDVFWIWHFHNASKENLNFMHGFKSAILADLKNWQNGTFEPVHEIEKLFWPKDFFWSIMKVPYPKHINNMFQGSPNPGFRLVKLQTEDFLKKDSQHFKNMNT